MNKFNILFLDSEFKTVCYKLQNLNLKSKIVELDFKEVLNSVNTINGEKINFEPFKKTIDFNNFYDFIFLDDENGVSKDWISLNLFITFSEDNFTLNLRTKDDSIIISTNQLSQYNFLQNVLSPYSEISLEEKLKILNLENQKSFFN